MKAIEIFNNDKFGEVRVATTENMEPLFCLADVCRILDLQTGATKNRLKAKGISLINTPTSSGNQNMIFIDEPNFYLTVFQSRKPAVEPFTDWVVTEVLPSIRKTGSYTVDTTFVIPKTLPEALRLAADQAEQIEQQQNLLKEQEPKVLFSDTVSSSPDLILIRELAKLASTETFTIGQNKLYKWMRIEGYLMSNNEPYQRYVDQGLFKVIERNGWNGQEMKISRTTKITGKGQTYFIDKLHRYFNIQG